MQGIVGFRCETCGHKITASFEHNTEYEVMRAWMEAKAKYDRHYFGPDDQEERDLSRCGEDCNG